MHYTLNIDMDETRQKPQELGKPTTIVDNCAEKLSRDRGGNNRRKSAQKTKEICGHLRH